MPIFRALIVEDNQIQLNSRQNILRQLFDRLPQELTNDPRFSGYTGDLSYELEISTANSFNEALRQFNRATHAQPFDLLWLDLALPEDNQSDSVNEDPEAGLRLLYIAKEKRLARAYVVISALRQLREKIWQVAGTDFLDKHISDQELTARLKSTIKQVLVTLGPEADLIRQLQKKLIGNSPALHHLFEQLASVIPTNQHVLLLGEPGTGKELVASCIHELKPGPKGRFLPINVNQFSEDLFASAFFGHERGSFTGAERRTEGLLEVVKQGTLLLDEIGDLHEPLQAKLLRVLEERQFLRIGKTEESRFEARVVSATNRDLKEDTTNRRFRPDLYSRLAQAVIQLPPLRERALDIEPLAQHFLREAQKEQDAAYRVQFTADALELICQQTFENGNVRELRALVGNLVASCRGDFILPGQVLRLVEQRRPKPTGPLSMPVATPVAPSVQAESPSAAPPLEEPADKLIRQLQQEIARELGADLMNRTWKELTASMQTALARVVFPAKRRQHGTVGKIADSLDFDTGTYYNWRDKAGLKDKLDES